MTFEIPLAEQKIKPHQITALHLMIGFALIASGAFIIFVFSSMMLTPFKWEPLPKDAEVNIHATLLFEYIMLGTGTAILFISLFRNKWLMKPRNNRIIRMLELWICMTLAIFSGLMAASVIAVIFGILTFAIIYSFYAENTGGQQPAVVIDENGISLRMNVRRHINWAETEKVLLRHGTLTISCLDNRLYQWITTQNNIDITNFEAFCNAQIEAAQKDRKKYDW